MALKTTSGAITKVSIAGDGTVQFTVQPDGGPPPPEPVTFKPEHEKQEKLIDEGKPVTVTYDDAGSEPYTANMVARP